MNTAVFISILLICSYFSWRNNKTHVFLKQVNNMCHFWNNKHINDPDYVSAYLWFYQKIPSYQRILYSFKAIKLESFVSDEEIKKIMS